MEFLVWGGAAVAALGIIGIGYSIVAIMRARRAGLDDDALKARITGILPINLGSLFVSMIGLMMVFVGVMFG